MAFSFLWGGEHRLKGGLKRGLKGGLKGGFKVGLKGDLRRGFKGGFKGGTLFSSFLTPLKRLRVAFSFLWGGEHRLKGGFKRGA